MACFDISREPNFLYRTNISQHRNQEIQPKIQKKLLKIYKEKISVSSFVKCPPEENMKKQ